MHGGVHLYLNLLFGLVLRDLLKELLQNKEVIGGVVHTQDSQSLLRLHFCYHLIQCNSIAEAFMRALPEVHSLCQCIVLDSACEVF